jgi:hypothetical protein
MCKDAVNRDSTCQSIFRRLCTAKKIEDRRFQIPCQPSRRRVIPSERSSVHCSIRPDDVSIPSERQTDQHHPSGRRIFPSRPSTVSRSFCSSLHPSGPLSIPSGRSSVHCSIRPDNVFIPSRRETDQDHQSGRRIFPSGPSTLSRSFCSNLHPSGPLSSPSERPSVTDQLQILSKFRIWED